MGSARFGYTVRSCELLSYFIGVAIIRFAHGGAMMPTDSAFMFWGILASALVILVVTAAFYSIIKYVAENVRK